MRYRVGILLSCLLFVAATSGCDHGESPDVDTITFEAVSVDGLFVECPVGKVGEVFGDCIPCPDYEGCFRHAHDMEFFYNRLIPLMDRFATATYSQMGSPAHWYYISTGDSGSDCGGFDDMAYFYCPDDDSVYLGEQQMWHFYVEQGDAAPAVGLAHEWGHFVQRQTGVFSVPATQANVINIENQADCIAGAWSAHWVRKGVFVDDDFDDVAALMPVIASAEGPDRDHGTIDERVDSWVLGYRQGMFGCNSYFPDVPIISN